MPRFTRESSSLRSPRDPDDMSRVHIRLEVMAKQIEWVTEATKRIQEQINRLRLRKGGDTGGDTTTSACPDSEYPTPYG